MVDGEDPSAWTSEPGVQAEPGQGRARGIESDVQTEPEVQTEERRRGSRTEPEVRTEERRQGRGTEPQVQAEERRQGRSTEPNVQTEERREVREAEPQVQAEERREVREVEPQVQTAEERRQGRRNKPQAQTSEERRERRDAVDSRSSRALATRHASCVSEQVYEVKAFEEKEKMHLDRQAPRKGQRAPTLNTAAAACQRPPQDGSSGDGRMNSRGETTDRPLIDLENDPTNDRGNYSLSVPNERDQYRVRGETHDVLPPALFPSASDVSNALGKSPSSPLVPTHGSALSQVDGNVSGERGIVTEDWFDALQCSVDGECKCASILRSGSQNSRNLLSSPVLAFGVEDDEVWSDNNYCVCSDHAQTKCAVATKTNPELSESCTTINDAISNNNTADNNTPCPTKTQSHNKVLNLTNRDLSEPLLNILSQGPNFALSRKICKKVLYHVEKGIEREQLLLSAGKCTYHLNSNNIHNNNNNNHHHHNSSRNNHNNNNLNNIFPPTQMALTPQPTLRLRTLNRTCAP